MAKKIKICPKCKNWVTDGAKCNICGEDLIQAEYTDMFFDKLSKEEQLEYITKFLTERESAKTLDSMSAKPNGNRWGKVLQIMGFVFIISGFVAGIVMAQVNYGKISFATFLIYVIAGLISGCFTLGFGEVISLLYSINQKLDKQE